MALKLAYEDGFKNLHANGVVVLPFINLDFERLTLKGQLRLWPSATAYEDIDIKSPSDCDPFTCSKENATPRIKAAAKELRDAVIEAAIQNKLATVRGYDYSIGTEVADPTYPKPVAEPEPVIP